LVDIARFIGSLRFEQCPEVPADVSIANNTVWSDKRMKNRLKTVRVERAVTLRQLARATDIKLTLLWELENDLRDPTREQREAICRALQVTDRQAWSAPRLHPLALDVSPGANVA
jgi:hypothetical protein